MAKLDHDNRILAELDRRIIDKSVGYHQQYPDMRPHSAILPSTALTHQTILDPHHLHPQMTTTHPPTQPLIFLPLNNLMDAAAPSHHHRSHYHHRHRHHSASHALHSSAPTAATLAPLVSEAKHVIDSIEVPNRGRARVFIAKYSYDPFRQSPNENPESELSLAAGDFVLVFGDLDSDGFYFGELIDGRRGLVPSNFVQQLTGEDLFEFQASVLYLPKDQQPSTTPAVNQDQRIKSRLQAADDFVLQHQQKTVGGGLGVSDVSDLDFPAEFYDAILDDAIGHTSFQHLLAPEDFHRMNDYVELADTEQEQMLDEDDLYPDLERAQAVAARDPVPPPKRLVVERQLHKSLLLSWLHPDAPRGFIDSFHVYVDGVLKIAVPANERTKALIEGVDSTMAHRISVRAVTPNGRMSKDAACTVVIGKNVPFAPCCVKATNITSESALISWLPCNSNFYHVVAVNSVEVKTVNASTYKHLITGLAANTLYRVSVRAKPGKLFLSMDEKNPKKLQLLTTFVDFRTLPKSLPEPPVDVQVESGPQEGTLLVTWLPVTLDAYGQSNSCPVTGYAVFAAHKKVGEIDSPTGDHALLDINQVESFHRKNVTVRTKSGENLSQDSIACPIPDDLLRYPTSDPTTGSASFMSRRRTHQSPHHHPHPQGVRPSSQGAHFPAQTSGMQLVQWIEPRTGMATVIDPITGMVRPASAPYPGFQGQMIRGQMQMQRPGQLGMQGMFPGQQPGVMPGQIQPGMMMGQQPGIMGQQQGMLGQMGQMGQMQQPGMIGMMPGQQPGMMGMMPGQQSGMMGMMPGQQPMQQQQQPGLMGKMFSSLIPGQTTQQQQMQQQMGMMPGQQQPQQQQSGLMGRMISSLIPGQPTQQQQMQQQLQQQQMLQQQRMMGQQPGMMMSGGVMGQPGMIRPGMMPGQQIPGQIPGQVPGQMMPGQMAGQFPGQALPGQTGLMGQTMVGGMMGQTGMLGQTLGPSGLIRPPGLTGVVPSQFQPGVRWFIALYDYDPLTMSPNPDGADEELGFRDGDVIKVFGEKDADGFYRGESMDGRSGFVPCNMVSEVSAPEALQLTEGGRAVPPGSRKMIALYDYDPQENSPNPDAEVIIHCLPDISVSYLSQEYLNRVSEGVTE